MKTAKSGNLLPPDRNPWREIIVGRLGRQRAGFGETKIGRSKLGT
jgi:hypothetical protein